MRIGRPHPNAHLALLSSVLAVGPFAGCKSGGTAAGSGGGATGEAAAAGGAVSLTDPKGDDDGPGTYIYPTDAAYSRGAFDMVGFEVVPQGSQVELEVTMARRIDDPWDSEAWNGNGFSVQMAFIHIDTDGAPGSGETVGMPGTNVRFSGDEAWDRVVIISPQPVTRVLAEVEAKAPAQKDKVVVPGVTRASGRTLVAVVDAADLGGTPQASWGYQVLIQSNEGYPDKGDLLTRKVNEYEGQHRFGGGTDYDNDPHVIDMLAGAARGGDDEIELQHAILSKYDPANHTPAPEDLVVVPMIYPGR